MKFRVNCFITTEFLWNLYWSLRRQIWNWSFLVNYFYRDIGFMNSLLITPLANWNFGSIVLYRHRIYELQIRVNCLYRTTSAVEDLDRGFMNSLLFTRRQIWILVVFGHLCLSRHRICEMKFRVICLYIDRGNNVSLLFTPSANLNLRSFSFIVT